MPDIRLIDANAVLKEIKETYCTDCNNYNGVMCRACEWMDAMDYIEDAPTVDAQPVKHGKWVDSGVGGTVRCSNCKFTDFFAKRDRVMLFDFCPGCGSRMIDSAEEVVEYEAQWILRSDKPDEYNNMKYECSRCGAGETFNINIDVPFCWKCGARMKKMHD